MIKKNMKTKDYTNRQKSYTHTYILIYLNNLGNLANPKL